MYSYKNFSFLLSVLAFLGFISHSKKESNQKISSKSNPVGKLNGLKNSSGTFFDFKVRTPEELIKDRSSAYDYLA